LLIIAPIVDGATKLRALSNEARENRSRNPTTLKSIRSPEKVTEKDAIYIILITYIVVCPRAISKSKNSEYAVIPRYF